MKFHLKPDPEKSDDKIFRKKRPITFGEKRIFLKNWLLTLTCKHSEDQLQADRWADVDLSDFARPSVYRVHKNRSTHPN